MFFHFQVCVLPCFVCQPNVRRGNNRFTLTVCYTDGMEAKDNVLLHVMLSSQHLDTTLPIMLNFKKTLWHSGVYL